MAYCAAFVMEFQFDKGNVAGSRVRQGHRVRGCVIGTGHLVLLG